MHLLPELVANEAPSVIGAATKPKLVEGIESIAPCSRVSRLTLPPDAGERLVRSHAGATRFSSQNELTRTSGAARPGELVLATTMEDRTEDVRVVSLG